MHKRRTSSNKLREKNKRKEYHLLHGIAHTLDFFPCDTKNALSLSLSLALCEACRYYGPHRLESTSAPVFCSISHTWHGSCVFVCMRERSRFVRCEWACFHARVMRYSLRRCRGLPLLILFFPSSSSSFSFPQAEKAFRVFCLGIMENCLSVIPATWLTIDENPQCAATTRAQINFNIQTAMDRNCKFASATYSSVIFQNWFRLNIYLQKKKIQQIYHRLEFRWLCFLLQLWLGLLLCLWAASNVNGKCIGNREILDS